MRYRGRCSRRRLMETTTSCLSQRTRKIPRKTQESGRSAAAAALPALMHLTCKMEVFFTVWGGLNREAKAIEIKPCKTAWTLDRSRGSSPYVAYLVHRER